MYRISTTLCEVKLSVTVSESAENTQIMCVQDECEEKLAVAMPAMNAAITALNTLKQNDITIVKTMTNPPAGVKLVLEAVCILKVNVVK